MSLGCLLHLHFFNLPILLLAEGAHPAQAGFDHLHFAFNLARLHHLGRKLVGVEVVLAAGLRLRLNLANNVSSTLHLFQPLSLSAAPFPQSYLSFLF